MCDVSAENNITFGLSGRRSKPYGYRSRPPAVPPHVSHVLPRYPLAATPVSHSPLTRNTRPLCALSLDSRTTREAVGNNYSKAECKRWARARRYERISACWICRCRVRECVAHRSSSTAGLSYQQGCRSTEPSVPATGGEPVAWRTSGRSPCQHRCGATAAQLVATSRQAASRDEQPRGLRPASSTCCRRGAAERARAATRVRVPGRPEARARKRAGLLANRCSLLGAALSQI